MIKLNLGCGNKPIKSGGWVNFDINPSDPIVRYIDLEKNELPYKDNTVSTILMSHVLEHIRNLKFVMNECHRVLEPGGRLDIHVPRWPHEDSVKDPTHVRFFVPGTFTYFDAEEPAKMYGFERWRIIDMDSSKDNVIKVLLRPEKGVY